MILLAQMQRTAGLYVEGCQDPILKLRNNFPDIERQTAFLLTTEEHHVPSSRIIQTLGVRSLLRLNLVPMCLRF